MTPQERELVADLFDRLARLEGGPRDPEAVGLINDGLKRAPNAMYALVQTTLVQDEALKRADARIRELEDQLGIERPAEPRDRGFLDNVRDALFGDRERPRTSVPPAGRSMGVPPGFGTGAPQGSQGYPPQGGYPQQGYGQQPGYPQQEPSRGGSFLGTAAAAAAGVIGGSMLLGGIRSAWGHAPSGQKTGAFDSDAGASGSDLARQAGVDDVGRGGGYGLRDEGGGQGYGLVDDGTDQVDASDVFDSDFDASDTSDL
jgi:uncharacterized protein